MIDLLGGLKKRLARLRGFPVLTRHGGATLVLDPKNWIDNRLIVGAPYEDAQIANAKRLIEAHRLDLVLDIGANFGLYSILLGMMETVRNVIAFEPVRRNHAQLMANIFVNWLENKIETHRVGISDRAGCATIHIDPISTGVSRLDTSTGERDPRVFRESEEIELAPLDSIVNLSGRRAFVKIDVEGHAMAVVAGMGRFLTENLCVLQIEISDVVEDGVRARLAELGFDEIGAIERDVVFASRAMSQKTPA